MSEDDISYFERRAGEERQRASDAKDPAAKKAHERIAEEYERIVRVENSVQLRAVSA